MPTRRDRVTEAWYPRPATYWVPARDEAERPFRYGDLFHTPPYDAAGTPLVNKDGAPWHAVLALSPSCELAAKARPTDTVEVARVYPLASQDPNAQRAILTGWQEKDGRLSVAFAHTIFLAPVPDQPPHDEPMFAHLKTTTRVTFAALEEAGRIGALDHDPRVHVIRREIYYRYRWLVSTDEVRQAEALRISNDPHFKEPRPPWGEFSPDE